MSYQQQNTLIGQALPSPASSNAQDPQYPSDMTRERPIDSGPRPLMPAAKPMTSVSTSSASSDKGDLAFSLEHKKSKSKLQVLE